MQAAPQPEKSIRYTARCGIWRAVPGCAARTPLMREPGGMVPSLPEGQDAWGRRLSRKRKTRGQTFAWDGQEVGGGSTVKGWSGPLPWQQPNATVSGLQGPETFPNST